MKWDWEKFYDKVQSVIVTYGPRLVMAIIVLFVGIWMIRLLNKWVKKVLASKRVSANVRYFLQNLIAITLQVVLVILALQVAGIQVTFLSAILAGFTVAAGLALSGTLQNFVSGILILFLKPYRVGENISTQGQEGTVTEIQLFYTTVLTFDNKTIIIPNGQLSNNTIINLSREGKRRLDVELRFPYVTDTAQVKRVLEKAVQQAEDILSEPVARIGVSAMEADKYVVIVSVWVHAHGYYDKKLALQEKLINDVKAAGIKFPGM